MIRPVLVLLLCVSLFTGGQCGSSVWDLKEGKDEVHSVLRGALSAASVPVPQDTAPGVNVALSQKGIDYLITVIIPIIEKQLSTITVPDVPFDKDSFEGSISSIKCDDISLSDATVTLGSGSSASMSVSGLSVKCSAHYDYKEKVWPHVPHGSGGISISTSGASAALSGTLLDSGGHPQVNVGDPSVSLGDLHLEFSGGITSDILNLLKGLFSSDIDSEIKSVLQSQLKSFMNGDVNNILDSITVTLPIPFPAPYNIASIDFGLTAAPTTNKTYIGADIVGKVSNTAHPGSSTFTPGPLPPFSTQDAAHYVTMNLDAYLFETGAEVFYDAGDLHYVVQPSLIPSSFPLQLNTTDLAPFAPGITKAYPNDKVQLLMEIVGAPQFVGASGEANVTCPVDLAFQPITTKGVETAFTLSCELESGFNATVGGATGHQSIYGHLFFLRCPLNFKNSTVGPVTGLDKLRFLTDFALGLLVSQANKFLAEGIPLPAVSGLSFTDTTVSFGSSYLSIASDFTYDPTTALLEAGVDLPWLVSEEDTAPTPQED